MEASTGVMCSCLLVLILHRDTSNICYKNQARNGLIKKDKNDLIVETVKNS